MNWLKSRSSRRRRGIDGETPVELPEEKEPAIPPADGKPADGNPAADAPAEDTPANTEAGSDDDDKADEGVSVRRILFTTVLCAFVAASGHVLIYIGWLIDRRTPGDGTDAYIPWEPCVAITLALIGVIAFGGFYAASLRARIAIASSFLLTFLVLLSFELSISELFQRPVALVGDLRDSVRLIVAFYFGSEAAISGAKALAVGFGRPENANKVMTSDRDLARRSPAKAAADRPRILGGARRIRTQGAQAVK